MGQGGRYLQLPMECSLQPDGKTMQATSVNESSFGSTENVSRGNPKEFTGVATVNSPETGEMSTPINSKMQNQMSDIKAHAAATVAQKNHDTCAKNPGRRFVVQP